MAENQKTKAIAVTDSDYPALIEPPFTTDHNAPAGEDNSDQYPDSLPRYFIDRFSQKGDCVLDPFLGFGTTAFAAEDLGRVPYGVEADGERFEWAAGQLTHWQNIVHGDAADIADFGFPAMDLCITSPPFMPGHEDWNPLYGGDPAFAGYACYIERMGFIFSQLRRVMKKGALVIVHVDDLHDVIVTPLIDDIQARLSAFFSFETKIEIRWSEDAPADYPQTQCLVFKA